MNIDIEVATLQAQLANLRQRLAAAEAEVIEERAIRMKAEFRREHLVNGRGDLFWCWACTFRSKEFEEAQGVAVSLSGETADERHTWTDDQWRQAAREGKLRE